MSYIEITNDLTQKGRKNIKVGQVLIFDFEGSPIHLKIMRKAEGRVWAKRKYLMTPEEADEKVTITPK